MTAILLDPSCSGSGIVSAPDRLHDGQGETEEEGGDGSAAGEGGGGGAGATSRVGRLAAFQLQGLLKAMSFPQVRSRSALVVDGLAVVGCVKIGRQGRLPVHC